MNDWVPPGYVWVMARVREHGVDKERNDLSSGRRQAFKFDRTTGELSLIEPRFWRVDGAERCLEYGWLAPPAARHFKIGEHSEVPCMIVVPVEDEPKPARMTNGVYLPPFMALMQEAVRELNISEQSWPKKKELEKHFCAQKLPDGTPVSPTQARYLATFCRPLEALRGGNT